MRTGRSLWLAALLVAEVSFAADTSTVTLEVRNMACQLCAVSVRKALEKVPGVESAHVDLQGKRAVVTFNPRRTDVNALTKATAAAGLPPAVK
jgi:mercuric ion binding protein